MAELVKMMVAMPSADMVKVFEQMLDKLRIESTLLEITEAWAEIKVATSTSAAKDSHEEYRACYDASDVPAAMRFGHQWLCGEEVTLSSTHLEIYKKEILRTHQVSATSMGYQFFNKDDRRSRFIMCTLYQIVVEDDEAHEVYPESAQQGILAYRLPAFREILKSHDETAYEKMPFKKIPEDLQAMYDYAEPVTNKYQVVKHEDRKNAPMDTQDMREVFEKLPDKIQQACNLAFPEGTSSVQYTELMVQMFQWLAVGQAAKSVIQTAMFREACHMEAQHSKRARAQQVESHLKVFEVVSPKVCATIEKAKTEQAGPFKAMVKSFELDHDISKKYMGPSSSS